MFTKLSLISFIYQLFETFYFLSDVVKKIFQKYSIKKVCIYHGLTGADGTCLKFICLNDVKSEIPDKQFRDILFEIIVASKIHKRFDSSHKYWENLMREKKPLKNA